MSRLFAIPIMLAIAAGLGYLAVVSSVTSGTILLDIAFVGCAMGFLALLVTELGTQLHRTSAMHESRDRRVAPGRTFGSDRNQHLTPRTARHERSTWST